MVQAINLRLESQESRVIITLHYYSNEEYCDCLVTVGRDKRGIPVVPPGPRNGTHIRSGQVPRAYWADMLKRGFKWPKVSVPWRPEEEATLRSWLIDFNKGMAPAGESVTANAHYWVSSRVMMEERTPKEVMQAIKAIIRGIPINTGVKPL